jgi:hypothetical protein
MLCTYTFWGYGPGFQVEVGRFTGAEADDARTVADELARWYGEHLYAVAVTKEDAEEIVYVTHHEVGRKGGGR